MSRLVPPGCSKSHLPSFITAQDELKAKGVELTICVATNDAYVMEVGWDEMSTNTNFRVQHCLASSTHTIYHCYLFTSRHGAVLRVVPMQAFASCQTTREN